MKIFNVADVVNSYRKVQNIIWSFCGLLNEDSGFLINWLHLINWIKLHEVCKRKLDLRGFVLIMMGEQW